MSEPANPNPPQSTVAATPTPASPEVPEREPKPAQSNPNRVVYNTRKPRFSEAHPSANVVRPAETDFGGRIPKAPAESAPAAEKPAEAQAEPAQDVTASEPKEAAPAETPASEPKPEDEAAEAKEVSKRMAKLVKQERAVAEEKQKLAAERQTMAQERAAITKENQRLVRVNQFLLNLEQEVRSDPVTAIKKHLGISPDDYIAAVFGEKPKAQPAAPQAPQVHPEIEALKKAQAEMRDAFEQQQQASVNKQVSDYKANVIAPFIQQNKDRYKLLIAERGTDAPAEVWALMQERYKPLIAQYGHASRVPASEVPSFEDAANDLEAYLKQQADKYLKAMGIDASVPKAQAETPKATAPVANTNNAGSNKTQQTLKHSDVARPKAKPVYKIRPQSF